MAYLICVQIEMVLGVFALVGVVSGAILDANRDYPTDPTPLFLLLWMLALIALLLGTVRSVAHWQQLFGGKADQPLDDPPAASPPKPGSHYGSERF